jgi:cell division septation protein DedD
MRAKNVRTFELKLGKRALAVFVIGVSFLLFVAFLLGIHVGKIMDAYPEKVARGIPHVIMEYFGWLPKKAESVANAGNALKEPAAGQDDKVDLTFYDTLARTGKDADVVEKKTPERAGTVSEKPSKPVNTGDSGLVPAKPSDKPSSPAVPERYQVQIVSLKEKEKAEQMCKKLVDLGYTPHILTAEIRDKGTWFRVVLDNMESQEKAQKAMDVVSKKIRGVSCVVLKKKSD